MVKQNSHKRQRHTFPTLRSSDLNVKIHTFHTLTVQRDIYGIKSIHFIKKMKCGIEVKAFTTYVVILQLDKYFQEKCLMKTLKYKELQLTVTRILNQQ